MTNYMIAAIPSVIVAVWVAMHLYRHGEKPIHSPILFFGSIGLVAVGIIGWSVGLSLLLPGPDTRWETALFGYFVINLMLGCLGVAVGIIASAARDDVGTGSL